MDPAVAARVVDPRQVTSLLVEMSTTPGRLYTVYPAGLVVSSKTYVYRPFEFQKDVITRNTTGRPSARVTISNSDNVVKDLATDFANRGKFVTVTKVHFNDPAVISDPAAWTIAGTEPLFYGTISRPRVVGEYVELICIAYVGRTGPTPRITMKDALATHTAPTTLNF